MAAPRTRRYSSISTIPVPDGPDNDYLYKIITLGNAGVGKSTLMASYCRGTHQTDLSQQLGVDSKIVSRGDRVVQISLWDTAGQERYDSITSNYYRGAKGCLLCFDITNEQSYADLITWHEKLKSHCDPLPATLLVGTKGDLRQSAKTSLSLTSSTDCHLAARNLGVTYKEVSCFKQEMVEEAFNCVIDMIEREANLLNTDSNNNKLTIRETEKQPLKAKCKNLC